MSDNKTGAKCLPTASTSLPLVTQADIALVMGAYCVIQLDNGDEAFYHHGHYVAGTDASCNDPSVMDIARHAARAGGKSLSCFQLPVPDADDWCWGDIEEKLARCAMTEDMRGSVIVTGSLTRPGGKGIHFCSHPLLSGINGDLWFPVAEGEDWFAAVERVLIMNRLAVNLTALVHLRDCRDFTDWKATYNRKVVI